MEKHEKVRLVFLFGAFANCGGRTTLEALREYLVRGKLRGEYVYHGGPFSEDQFDETIELAKRHGVITVDEFEMVTLVKRDFFG